MQLTLTESLNRSRIKANFKSFFSELGEDITDIVLNKVYIIFQHLKEHITKKLDGQEFIIFFLDSLNSLILNNDLKTFADNIPTIYVEKLLSSLKKIYENNYKNSPSEFLNKISNFDAYDLAENRNAFENPGQLDDEIKVIVGYSILAFFKIFVTSNGLNSLNKDLNALESKVYNDNYDIFGDVYKIIENVIRERNEKEKNRMSNLKVFENENIEVYKVDGSRQACIIMGKGTDWCIANTHTDEHYKNYSSSGDMYVFIFKKIKNTFDGGQEKALLTIKNKKYSSKNNFDGKFEGVDFKKLIEKIKANNYTLKPIIEFKNQDITEDFKKMINDKDIEIFNEENQKVLEEDRKNITNYFVGAFVKALNNKVMPIPENAPDLGTIYQNDSFELFLKEITNSAKNIFLEFCNESFNLDNLEKYFKPKYNFITKLIKFKEKYPWAKNILQFNIKIRAAFLIDGERVFIDNDVPINKYTAFIGMFYKYPYELADSGNKYFNFITPKTENDFSNENMIRVTRFERLSEYILEWPELQEKLFNVDIDDIKTLIRFIDKLTYYKKQYSDSKPEFKFLARDKRVGLINYMISTFNDKDKTFETVIQLFNKSYPNFKLTKILNFYETHTDIIYPIHIFFNSIYHLNNIDDLEFFNSFVRFFIIHKNYDKADAMKRFCNDSINHFENKGFFKIKEGQDKEAVINYFMENLKKELRKDVSYYELKLTYNSIIKEFLIYLKDNLLRYQYR